MATRLRRAPHVCLAICLIFSSAGFADRAGAQVIDEARKAGRAAQSFPAADEDYFQGMDGGVALTADEVKGRNMCWCGPAATTPYGTS